MQGGVHAQRLGNSGGTPMRRWIDELSFRARVVLTILIVAITITIAVISWDDIGNWKAAFEAAGTKILR